MCFLVIWVNRAFKTSAVKFGVPACQRVNQEGGQVWTICCHVDLSETEGRGGEQADNDWSVSAQQQQAHRFQGSLRPQLVLSVNT